MHSFLYQDISFSYRRKGQGELAVLVGLPANDGWAWACTWILLGLGAALWAWRPNRSVEVAAV